MSSDACDNSGRAPREAPWDEAVSSEGPGDIGMSSELAVCDERISGETTDGVLAEAPTNEDVSPEVPGNDVISIDGPDVDGGRSWISSFSFLEWKNLLSLGIFAADSLSFSSLLRFLLSAVGMVIRMVVMGT